MGSNINNMIKFISMVGEIKIYGKSQFPNLIQKEILWNFAKSFKFDQKTIEMFYYLLSFDQENGIDSLKFFLQPYLTKINHFLAEEKN